MSVKKVKWIAIDGSVYVDEVKDRYNPEFKVRYKVREAVAFNVGQDVAEHIARLHNTELEMKNVASA